MHLTVEALAQPAQQVTLIVGDIDARNAHGPEAECGGVRRQLAPETAQIYGTRFRHGIAGLSV
jgi:hypothetical protein